MPVRDEYLPELELARQDLARRAAADPAAVRFKTADYGGLRTEADTTRILQFRDADYAAYEKSAKAAGKVPVSKARFRPINAFGSSHHNYGAAFDAEPTSIRVAGVTIAIHKTPAAAAIWKTDPKRAAALYQQAHDVLDRHAAAAGLRAGDSFTNPDEPHFELPITIEEARRRWTLHKNPPSSPPGGSAPVPPPGGSSSSSSSSNGPPRANAGLLLLGSIAVVGAGLLLARVIRG